MLKDFLNLLNMDALIRANVQSLGAMHQQLKLRKNFNLQKNYWVTLFQGGTRCDARGRQLRRHQFIYSAARVNPASYRRFSECVIEVLGHVEAANHWLNHAPSVPQQGN